MELADINFPLVVAGAVALVVVLTVLFCGNSQVVVHSDGTKIRYLYPVAASGWLPFLGHAMRVISDEAPDWIVQNFKANGYRQPFYIELLGHRIVQSSGPDFQRAIVRAPDDKLCSKKGNAALFNFELSFGSTDMQDRPFQIKLIHTTFVPLRKQLAPNIEKGLKEALEQQFPSLHTAGDYTIVSPLHTVIFDMIGSMLSVILTGDELGRDPELVLAMKELTSVINEITFKSNSKPKFLVDRRRLQELTAIVHKHIEAEVQERRLKEMYKLDFLQLLVDARDDQDQEYPPDVIANRMLGIVFATFDTTATALTNLLLEVASPSKTAIKRRIQTEVDSIPAGPPLTQDIISQSMTYSKVCLYESLRRPKSVISAPLRKVVNEDFRVPMGKGADGIKEVAVIPQGYILSFNDILVNHDPNNFDSPETFDPDRNQLNNQHGVTAAGIAKKTVGFGLGRHECPGRFFAAEEIQVALVVLFRYFDFSTETDFQPKCKGGVAVNDDPMPVRVTLKKAGEKLLKDIRTAKSSA